MSVCVGVLDSGVGLDCEASVAARRMLWMGESSEGATPADTLGHGAEVARIIVGVFPEVRLLDARIFGTELATSANTAAAGLHWLTGTGAQLINMSFGMPHDHPILAAACREAQQQGVVLLASSPARGPAVYPASYPGVIRICGDARCREGGISDFGGNPADFGFCPRPWNGGRHYGGASLATAYASGHLARFLDGYPSANREACVAYLRNIAQFHGRERIGA